MLPPPPDRPSRHPLEGWITVGIVLACVVFTFTQLQPDLIFRNTTPAGGDMAAHVWAPAYLRDHLLPNWQLTGWTPDWYAGFPALRFYMVPPMLAIVILDVFLPYGVAFKLVSVAGVLSLPVAAWAFGRLAGLKFPTPALLAVATVPFLFDRTFSIYGGNIPSTLAGEFAFSISLSLAVLYLGLVIAGLRTGRYRGWAALVVGLVGLTHVIPLIFAIAGTAVAFAVWPSRRGLRWLLTSAPVGALLAAWWLLPFWWQRAFLNDMGWVKLTPPDGAGFPEQVGFWLTNLFPTDTRWAANLALAGLVIAVLRRQRVGWFLAAMVGVGAVGFVLVPQGRLWNARLLPFIHLLTYALAAFAVAEGLRWLAESLKQSWSFVLRGAGALATLGVVLAMVALPLRALPVFGEMHSDGTYQWLFLKTQDSSYIPGWARWNYRGYEGKDHWTEYHDLILTMGNVGERNGCGRAMWEYDKEALDRYGSPMALMLLPYWTDGCIGSMEGLYFESATTTPFHFLNQSALSVSGSRAQRDLPYGHFDPDLGFEQLQMLGVKYYMAQSDQAIAAADRSPLLAELVRSGDWVVYEVSDSPLVEPLVFEPVVLGDVHDAGHEWIPVVAPWFQNPERWAVHLASDGPEAWARVDGYDEANDRPRTAIAVTPTPLPPVEVTNIESGQDWVSFDVSEPGVPVLVKISYFPNWQAQGAEGPWRVSPSFMVVVPTDTHVELRYGRQPVEIAGWGLTLVGMVALVALFRQGPIRPDPDPPGISDEPSHRGPAPGRYRLSVVIPAYQEAEAIGDGVRRLRSELATFTTDLEIVVVDDGSADTTAAEARAAGADQVIVLRANRGKGAAVRAGMLAASGRTLVFTDADLAYAPDQVAEVARLVEAGWDIVVGNRHIPGAVAEVQASWLRRAGGWLVNQMVRTVVGDHSDTQCGLKAFRSDVAHLIFSDTRIDGFGFDVEIFALAERHGLALQTAPVRVVNSTGSTVRVVRDGATLAADLFRVARWLREDGYTAAKDAELPPAGRGWNGH